MAIADKAPQTKVDFGLGQILKAQLKDYLAGNFTGHRNLKPGEPMFAGYAFGTKFVEIGGQRPTKASDADTKVTLVGYVNPNVKFRFYIGVGDVPSFINNGNQGIKVNVPYASQEFPNGQKTVPPGECVNLPPQGGSLYSVDLPNKDGSSTRIVFQNQLEPNTSETITQIVQSPTPISPTKL